MAAGIYVECLEEDSCATIVVAPSPPCNLWVMARLVITADAIMSNEQITAKTQSIVLDIPAILDFKTPIWVVSRELDLSWHVVGSGHE